MHRRSFSLAAGLITTAVGCSIASLPARAAFPDKPVTIVVSDQAGGPADVIARTLGQQLSASLKQPVIVENRPGAYTTLGLAQVAKAKPDGYTLGIMFMPHTVLSTLYTPAPRAGDDIAGKIKPCRTVERRPAYRSSSQRRAGRASR